MGRIMGIDYGNKRTGIAWTDPMQIIATGVGSFDTESLADKIQSLYKEEVIDAFVVGYPTRWDGSDSHVTQAVRDFAAWLETTFPKSPVHLWDERFTSKQAKEALRRGGASKKKRRDKHLVNEISATLILQDFLSAHSL